jgi:RNase P/RNase MRP subunit POP5
MKRIKRRYLALQVEGNCSVGEHDFLDALWAAVTKIYGEYGASLTSFALVSYDVERKFGVLRVNLVVSDKVRAAIALITSIGGCACVVHVLAVSGTIKGVRRNLAND